MANGMLQINLRSLSPRAIALRSERNSASLSSCSLAPRQPPVDAQQYHRLELSLGRVNQLELPANLLGPATGPFFAVGSMDKERKVERQAALEPMVQPH